MSSVTAAPIPHHGIDKHNKNFRGWLIVLVAFFADAISLGARSLFVVGMEQYNILKYYYYLFS
jgi:hypothetical protein